MSDVFDTADPTPGYRYDSERGTWVPDTLARDMRKILREFADSVEAAADKTVAAYERADEDRPAAVPSAQLEPELRWTAAAKPSQRTLCKRSTTKTDADKVWDFVRPEPL